MRRTTGWLLTAALLILIVDIGLERARPNAAGSRPAQFETADGGNGRPPTPMP
jgi:hypothetical protein